MIQIEPYGDQALLVNFEQKIDPAINRRVVVLSEAIIQARIPGVRACIPAYCSLTICYQIDQVRYSTLRDRVMGMWEGIEAEMDFAVGRKLFIPVCYEADLGLDQEAIAAHTQLTVAQLIAMHTNVVYQVYMLGFLPGFAYMGALPDALFCPRKDQPRLKVPAGAVGLAGAQTGIYPSMSPGGWQIIGQTPLPLLLPQQDPPFLFRAGDQVQFKAISKIEFDQIKQELAEAIFEWSNVYV